jgi:hypothetical protein
MSTKLLRKTFIYSLVTLFLANSLPAQATLVDNQQLAQQAQTAMQRSEVRDLLARTDVRAALLDYGVSEDAVDARIDSLTASELQQMHAQLADLPAGAEGALGLVLGIIFVFIVLDLLGATDVFPRI